MMATFNVFSKKIAGVNKKERFYRGMAEAAKVFHAKYNNSDKSEQLYGEVFNQLLTAGYDVTYRGDAGEKTITLTHTGRPPKWKLFYEGRRIKIRGGKDDATPTKEVVTMSIPDKRPNLNATYLQNIIEKIVEKKNNNDTDVTEYLLGVILMTKCR